MIALLALGVYVLVMVAAVAYCLGLYFGERHAYDQATDRELQTLLTEHGRGDG